MWSPNEKKQVLRRTNLFAELPDELLGEVADRLQIDSIKAGQALFSKGDPGCCMFIILEGRLRVHDGELTFNYLEKGDIVGEMAVLDQEVRSATVTAETDATLFRLDQSDLLDVMARDFNTTLGIIHVLSQHLRHRLVDMNRDFQYIQQVNLITGAARAVEAGEYQAHLLNLVTLREDELGQLARVFQRMADEVILREQRLKQAVQELRIQLDEARQQKDVAEITESEYFKNLRSQADQLRGIIEGRGE